MVGDVDERARVNRLWYGCRADIQKELWMNRLNKSINQDVAKFCETCATCKRTKSDNQKPYGLLNPLQIPDKPWESIGIDFVDPLPVSENRNGEFDMLVVVIDRLTSMIHLVPGRQDHKSKEMAELIFSEIYRLHGLPRSIVSDRDTIFTSLF
jgi:hypothetical protein